MGTTRAAVPDGASAEPGGVGRDLRGEEVGYTPQLGWRVLELRDLEEGW